MVQKRTLLGYLLLYARKYQTPICCTRRISPQAGDGPDGDQQIESVIAFIEQYIEKLPLDEAVFFCE